MAVSTKRETPQANGERQGLHEGLAEEATKRSLEKVGVRERGRAFLWKALLGDDRTPFSRS